MRTSTYTRIGNLMALFTERYTSDPTAWGPWGRGQTKPFDSRNDGVPQRRGNVILLKKHCKCQGGMGCLNRRDSHSDCLNELTVDEVWDALKELEVVA